GFGGEDSQGNGDSLYGDGGNDTLKGGGGADYLDGGSGNDTATYFGSGEGVNVSLTDHTAAGGDADGETLVSIENLTGSDHDGTPKGDIVDNVLDGGNGDDTLNGGFGHDTLNGGDGNDTLNGGNGIDTLNGGTGNDTAAYTDSAEGVIVSLADHVAAFGDA